MSLLKHCLLPVILILACINGFGQVKPAATVATIVNDKKAIRQDGSTFYIWYSSKKTDTKDYLCNRYYVKSDTLVRYNAKMVWNPIPEKTLLRIPVTKENFSFTKKVAVADTAIALYYTPSTEESLQQLSKRYFGVPAENIRIWNNLVADESKVQAGNAVIIGYLRRKKTGESTMPTTLPVAKKTPITSPNNQQVGVVAKEKTLVSPIGKKTTIIETKPVLVAADKKTVLIPSTPVKTADSAKSVTDVAREKIASIVVKKDSIIKPILPVIGNATPIAPTTLPEEEKDKYILNKNLASNRVNYSVRLSYVRSAFTGKDAVVSTLLIKTNNVFEPTNIAGKNAINAFSGGVGVENKFGKLFSLQTELLYEKKGGNINIAGAQTINEPVKGKVKVRLNYISFALLPRVSTGKSTIVYAYGGLYGGFLLSSAIEGEASVQNNGGTSSVVVSNLDNRKFTKADLGYATGLGIKFPYRKSKRQHLILEGRLSQSFNTVGQDVTGVQAIPQFLNRAYYVTLAYEFNR
jgi:hypothetical protein